MGAILVATGPSFLAAEEVSDGSRTPDGRFQVFAVWRSAEDGQRSLEDRLRAGDQGLAGEEAFAELPEAERVQIERHDHIVP